MSSEVGRTDQYSLRGVLCDTAQFWTLAQKYHLFFAWDRWQALLNFASEIFASPSSSSQNSLSEQEVGYFHGGGAGRLARLVTAFFFFSSSARQRWLASLATFEKVVGG